MKTEQILLPANCYFGPNNPSSYVKAGTYKDDIPAKNKVFLHFTVSHPGYMSAWQTFKTDPQQLGYPVGVAWIVDGDGTCVNCFDDKYWAFHIGVQDPTLAHAHLHDRESVGIEIANEGPLVLGHDGKTLTWNPPANLPFCMLDETDKYVKLPTPFRGVSYFAKFPEAQVEAVVELVTNICDRYEIPKVLPPMAKRFEFDIPYFANFAGVVSHVNFIDKWKWDLAPVHSDGIYSGLLHAGFTEAAS
jgi:hypothetical protein